MDEIPPHLLITVTDARRAGYCARGIRRWFEEAGGDFPGFLEHGITAGELLSLNDDALARRVIHLTMERAANGER